MNKDIVEIIKHYGVNPQQKKLAEELFELQEAITEYEMVKDNKVLYSDSYLNKCYHHIAEEIADVTLLIEQFRKYYDIRIGEIENITAGKIDRTFKRIDKELSEC